MSTSTPDLQSLSKEGIRRRRLRLECIEILGRYRDDEGEVRSDPRCKNPDCRWHNDDGTIGCNDMRALQFDHKDGGGSAERSAGRISGGRLYGEIKKHPERFQLLCATCHEIKKKVENQAQGARQHKQPARVRRSQQIEGQPVRRVREQGDGTKTPASQPFSN